MKSKEEFIIQKEGLYRYCPICGKKRLRIHKKDRNNFSCPECKSEVMVI